MRTEFICISARLRLPPQRGKRETTATAIKKLTDALAQAGKLVQMNVELQSPGVGLEAIKVGGCPICGWTHNSRFTQIKMDGAEAILLSGRLSEIVGLVHRAHENGFAALSTKDDALLEICAGYGNPCKAFDDLNHRADYKRLFDTSRRGFISLRGAVGRIRNKSESISEHRFSHQGYAG